MTGEQMSPEALAALARIRERALAASGELRVKPTPPKMTRKRTASRFEKRDETGRYLFRLFLACGCEMDVRWLPRDTVATRHDCNDHGTQDIHAATALPLKKEKN